jgi:hypothetical protein
MQNGFLSNDSLCCVHTVHATNIMCKTTIQYFDLFVFFIRLVHVLAHRNHSGICITFMLGLFDFKHVYGALVLCLFALMLLAIIYTPLLNLNPLIFG